MPEYTAGELYRKRIDERSTYLNEGHRSAKLTIPSVMPDEVDYIEQDRSTANHLVKPDQSLGARGVNNLAAKLLTTLFPPTSSFFRYVLSEKSKDEAEATATDTSELESALARRESRINTEVELQGLRTKLYQVLRHLLIVGNVLAYYLPDGGMRVIPLNAYTVKRDAKGMLLDLIFVELMDRSVAPDDILQMAQEGDPGEEHDERKPICIFTRVLYVMGRYESWQEVGGMEVPGTREVWKPEMLPFRPLRYTAVDGEDYGRGFVEEYRGDLTAFEQMSRDMKYLSANAAKLVWRMNPNSVMKPRKFLAQPNGGVVVGNEGDLEAMQANKGGDAQVATLQMDRLERALAASFLLNSSFQRNAERVTAEEVRRLAEELEDTLGGVFSLLSQELQLPTALVVEAYLIRTEPTFHKLPEGSVRIGVVTGLAAIGRNQDLERFRGGLGMVVELSQAMPGIMDYHDEEDVVRRIWTGHGVDTDGLVKDKDEVTQERQQRAQQQSQQTLGEEMAGGMGTAVGNVGSELPPEVLAEMAAGATRNAGPE